MADEARLIEQIHQATGELDAARKVVHDLANDLADVADVIEPVLENYAKRIRLNRMALVDECRQISESLKTFHDAALAPRMLEAIERSERLLKACTELEQFRLCGFLDAYLKAFSEVERQQ